jgi:methanogenic corrinoid protein MtbC1
MGFAHHHNNADENGSEVGQGCGFGGKVKMVVGRAPVTEEFARQIGAEGYAADAASAVSKVKQLLGVA